MSEFGLTRIPVFGGATTDGIRDPDVFPMDSSISERPTQNLTAPPYEGFTGSVLLHTRSLADEKEIRLRWSDAVDNLRARLDEVGAPMTDTYPPLGPGFP